MVSQDARQKKAGKWRRMALAAGGLGVAVAGACMARALWVAPATAQSAAQSAAVTPQTNASPAPSTGGASDYTSSVAATIHEHTVLTREDLGEYLIARFGVSKLETLVNNRIIDKYCRQHDIHVDGGEIEKRFADDLKGVNLDRASFVHQVLRRAHKNLYEWKEDVLRQQLLLAKVCSQRVTVTEAEIRDGYEARYGEKVECRAIHWDNRTVAETDYQRARDDEKMFEKLAKEQHTTALAATGGKISAFGRGNLENKDLENAAFALKIGEVSPLIKVPDGFIVLKCDARIPANNAVSLENVRDTIRDEIKEKKVLGENKTILMTLREEAHPQLLLEKSAVTPEGGTASHGPNSQVATIFGTTVITREELGQFLIARLGAEQLPLLVNKRIIEDACRAKQITVTEEEVDAGCAEDCLKEKCDEQGYIEDHLKPNNTTVFQWREDIVRPRLMLSKLTRERVKATEEDLHMAFDAYHGEKVECRMILWPLDSMKVALMSYEKLRESDKAFDEAAKVQASPSLSKAGGKLVIGRHTTGDAMLEKKAFGLSEGEMSEVFGTPQGVVLLKCDRHIPPDTSFSFGECRADLEREVISRKVQLEMPQCFAELRKIANPRLVITDGTKSDQLNKEQIEKEIKDVSAAGQK
jgi:parvulin-like peptidyl-prolyl isomerase